MKRPLSLEERMVQLERRVLWSGLGAFALLALGIISNFGFTAGVRHRVDVHNTTAGSWVQDLLDSQAARDSALAVINVKLDSLLQKEEK